MSFEHSHLQIFSSVSWIYVIVYDCSQIILSIHIVACCIVDEHIKQCLNVAQWTTVIETLPNRKWQFGYHWKPLIKPQFQNTVKQTKEEVSVTIRQILSIQLPGIEKVLIPSLNIKTPQKVMMSQLMILRHNLGMITIPGLMFLQSYVWIKL